MGVERAMRPDELKMEEGPGVTVGSPLLEAAAKPGLEWLEDGSGLLVAAAAVVRDEDTAAAVGRC